MKNFKILTALIISGLLTIACSDEAFFEGDLQTKGQEVTGNGGPSGPHYNLNIIGVPKELSADMDNNNGHRIFVPLEGQTKIMLTEGDDFQVLDANGTDGRAEFQLPNPDPDGDGMSLYSIFMRALGTPGGSATITTCADADLTDGYYEICTADPLEVESATGNGNGPPKFENVSRKLLTIYVPETYCAILNEDGVTCDLEIKKGRYAIFDPIFEDYFWKYDNDGLKLLQLRFYEIPTDLETFVEN